MNDALKKLDDLREEGIVLSPRAFALTKKTLILRDNTLLSLSDIAIVSVHDNSTKINIGRWIAIIIVIITMFLVDYVPHGHVDMTDLFFGAFGIGVIIYMATSHLIDITLTIKTLSGEEHSLATVGFNDVSYEDVHYWRGILSATGVDWKRD